MIRRRLLISAVLGLLLGLAGAFRAEGWAASGPLDSLDFSSDAVGASIAEADNSSQPTSVPAAVASPGSIEVPGATSTPGANAVGAASSSPSAIVDKLLHPSQWEFPRNFSIRDPNSWPFIPVPEVATDPNGGTTGGILAAVLFTDQQSQITDILAPDVETNTTLGPGGTFRFLSYPSEDTQWYATGGAQQKIARHVDIDYQTGRTHKQWWSFEGRFFFEQDPTERFFGVGNDTRLGNQSNYTTEQVYGLGVFGLNLTEDLQLSYTLRPRRVRIHDGAFNLPSIFQLFPNQKGVEGGTEVLNQLMLSYDTRDSIEIPRSGGVALVYGALADRRFMSSVSYTRFGGELRRYYSFNSKVTLAAHAFMEYMPAGNEAPFWSMSRLGGEDSLLTDQQTLRGYGSGRFVDNNLAVANAEVRTRVWDHDVFGTHGILELAPFVDIGRVGHDLDYNPFDDLHTVGGMGIRGIAQPFVVGYIDVGYGGEGVAVFTGVNYPF